MTSHFFVRRAAPGFTMVELIVVMILVGILSAIGVSRYFDRGGFDASAFATQTTSILRYAQKLAIAQNRSILVRLDGGGIALFVCPQNIPSCPTTAVPAPSGGNSATSKTLTYCGSSNVICEALPANISYAISPATMASFYFDAQGRPFAASDTDGSFDSTFVTLTMTITGDGLSRTVTVTPETGYVY